MVGALSALGSSPDTDLVFLARLKSVLYYHPKSGDFIRLEDASNQRAGTQAGCIDSQGYMRISIDGVRHKSHRLAFFYMRGRWPKEEVDHRDTVKHHNWWSNLREADRSQNRCNQKAYKNNALGEKGINWYPRYQKYAVKIQFDYERRTVGYFSDLSEAIAARNKALAEQHGPFARVA